jgi:hypothetical protein
MMPQKQNSEARQQQADPEYGRYEGNQTSSASLHYETFSEQEMRERSSGKVYPPRPDKMKIFRFAMPVIALGLLVLFGFLFVVVVGGTAGWVSFAAACFVLCCILAYTHTISQPGE